MKKPYVPLKELCAGIAEEATELAQAALKLRRVWDMTNPTPVSEEVAINKLEEEIADLFLYLEQMPFSRKHVEEIKKAKDERWQTRLEYYRGKEE